jgi:Ca-activated chloride channel family protein
VVAARATEAGVPVHTVGIGERGARPVIGGRQPVQLDEETLRVVARETGGSYFYAAEAADLEQIYGELGSQVHWVEERTEVTALVSALGGVLLTLGGLLGLLWFGQLP